MIEEIKETEAGPDSARYIFMGMTHVAKKTDTETLYYGVNHLGATKLLTDETGEIVNELTDKTNPFGDQEEKGMFFTGKQWDEDAQLYYFNARWYDAGTGGFITEDPVKDSTLWYAYVSNNPMKFVDPDGLESLSFTNTKDYLYFLATKTQGSGSVIAGALLGDDKSQETLAKTAGVAIMETGMDVGQNVSTIGDMAVFAGAVSAQPSFIVGGALAGEIGDAILLGSAYGKAAITGDEDDLQYAFEETVAQAAEAVIGDFARRNIRKIPAAHSIVNNYSRNFTDKKVGAFSRDVISTTDKVVSSSAETLAEKIRGFFSRRKERKEAEKESEE